MGRVLIIGAGGVGGVVTHKCAQVPEVFTEICLASRTLEKCEKIKEQISHRPAYAKATAGKENDVEERVANQRGIISNKLTRPPDISTKSLSRLHRSL